MCRAPHALRIYAGHLNTHNARSELIKVRLIIFAKLNFIIFRWEFILCTSLISLHSSTNFRKLPAPPKEKRKKNDEDDKRFIFVIFLPQAAANATQIKQATFSRFFFIWSLVGPFLLLPCLLIFYLLLGDKVGSLFFTTCFFFGGFAGGAGGGVGGIRLLNTHLLPLFIYIFMPSTPRSRP